MLIKKSIPIPFIIYKADRSELTHNLVCVKETCGSNILIATTQDPSGAPADLHQSKRDGNQVTHNLKKTIKCFKECFKRVILLWQL